MALDLVWGLVLISALAVVLFLATAAFARRLSAATLSTLAVIVVGALLLYIRSIWYDVRLAAVFQPDRPGKLASALCGSAGRDHLAKDSRLFVATVRFSRGSRLHGNVRSAQSRARFRAAVRGSLGLDGNLPANHGLHLLCRERGDASQGARNPD
jgi:hypothetical protein